MKTKEVHLGKMETRLKRWGAKLDKLVATAEDVDTDAKVDYRKRIADLKSKHRVAESKFDELKAAGDAEWDTIKNGVESAWGDLDVAWKTLSRDTRSLFASPKRIVRKTAAARSQSSAKRTHSTRSRRTK